MCRAENPIKCKDFAPEGQTRKGVIRMEGILPLPFQTPATALSGVGSASPARRVRCEGRVPGGQ